MAFDRVSQFQPISAQDSKLFIYLPNQIKSDGVTLIVRRKDEPESMDGITMRFKIKELTNSQPSQSKHSKTLLSVSVENLLNEIAIENSLKQDPMNEEVIARNGELFTHKYEPRKFSDLLSDGRINRDVLGWLQDWGTQKPQNHQQLFFKNPITINRTSTPIVPAFLSQQHSQIILLAGAPGTGKTTLARVVAKKCGYRVIEINASDERTAQGLIQRIEDMCCSHTIGKNQKTLVILDEVDGALESESQGAINKVLEYILEGPKLNKNPKRFNRKINKNEENKMDPNEQIEQEEQQTQLLYIKRPVIFICNDPYARGLRELKKKARVFYFKNNQNMTLVSRIKEICAKENIALDVQAINRLCEANGFDIRACLGALQMMKVGNSKLQSQSLSKSVIQHLQEVFFGPLRGSQDLMMTLIKQVEPQLLMEATFSNYLGVRSCQKKFHYIPHFLNQLCISDQIEKAKLRHNFELLRFIPVIELINNIKQQLPLVYFNNKLSSNQDKSVLQYPFQPIEVRRKTKLSSEIIGQLIGTKSINKSYFTTILCSHLYQIIQPRVQMSIMTSDEQKELHMSLAVLDSFHIEVLPTPTSFIVNENQEQEVNFKPQIERLITFTDVAPIKRINEKSRTLILNLLPIVRKTNRNQSTNNQQEEVKFDYLEKYDLLKRKRIKVTEEDRKIIFRFQEGQSTPIVYPLKMNYLFQFK